MSRATARPQAQKILGSKVRPAIRMKVRSRPGFSGHICDRMRVCMTWRRSGARIQPLEWPQEA